MTPPSCTEKFVGEIALHLRWENSKKAYSFPTISNKWGRMALHLGREYPFEHTNTNFIFKWLIYGLVKSIGIDFDYLTVVHR